MSDGDKCKFKKKSWTGGSRVPGGLEVGVTNMVVRIGLTEKVILDQVPKKIWRKIIPGKRTEGPRVLTDHAWHV